MFIIGGPGSAKSNSLFNLISQQPDIDKVCWDDSDSYEAKYQLQINKREGASTKHFNDFEAFIEYWNDVDDVYKNFQEYNPKILHKMRIIFDSMIVDMLSDITSSNWIIY